MFGPCHCGQTAAWIKMALGMEVGLGLGHIVLWGPSSPSPRKGRSSPLLFGPCYIVATVTHLSYC